MSFQVTLERPTTRPPRRIRAAAVVTVAAARVLALLPPRRLLSVLRFARRGARPAGEAETLLARDAVVAVSVPCAGPRCLQRSIATALLCRWRGAWPDWYTGVCSQPFRAHAWVAVDGRPIGENADWLAHFQVQLAVPAAAGRRAGES